MFGKAPGKYSDVAFWEQPERCGWLMKQGDAHNCIHNPHLFLWGKGSREKEEEEALWEIFVEFEIFNGCKTLLIL